MAGNGASGFMEGLMQGALVGDRLANRVAQFRSGRRMGKLQDRIDAGEFDAKNFGGDSAAAQQALQVATREAQAPLSNRGLDTEYGTDQYDRLMQLQQLRANQRGGAMMNKGDMAGGMETSGRESAALGNLPAALQSGQLAGQMRAGQSSIHNDGPGGTPQVNQAELTQRTAANAAQFGDVSGAESWADKAKVDAQASIQGMLGRAMTVATNPKLGGPEAAAPMLHAAAQLAGYGDLQYSPKEGKFFILGSDGGVNAAFGPEEISQFAETIGRDPEQILPSIQKMREESYKTQQEGAENDRRAARDQKYGLQRDAAQEKMRASLYGATHSGRGRGGAPKPPKPPQFKLMGSAFPLTDQEGNVVGQRQYAIAPGTGQPIVVTMHAPNPNDIGSGPAVTATDLQGNPVDLSGGGGGAMGLPQASAPALPGRQLAPPPSVSPQSREQSRDQMNGLPPPSTFLLR